MDINTTWDTLLKIAAGLIVLFEFGKWIISFGNPIVELRKRVEVLENYLNNDKDHFTKIDQAIKEIDDGVVVLGKAINEMLKHEITGNDIDELKKHQRRVNDYFYGEKEHNR